MKCLLTSDLHLSGDKPKRLDALDEILRLGEEEEIKYLFIAGDLFDKEVDVENLKVRLREKFSDLPYEVIAVPGNHDETAYREEDYFGENFTLLRDKPCTQKDLGDVNLLAVPYFKEGDFECIIDDLLDRRSDDKTNVLLLHCTLSGLVPEKCGEEDEYLPVTIEQLFQADFDYVFAGHVHSSSTKKVFDSKCIFLYPGSPVSITQNETGRRGVWLIDTEDREPEHVSLNTFFYGEKELDLCPGEAEEKLEDLEKWIQDENWENAELLISVQGFIEIDEGEFSQKLEEIKAKADALKVDVDNKVKSAKSIIETELYQRFKEKLGDEVSDEEKRRTIEKLGLEAFSKSARR